MLSSIASAAPGDLDTTFNPFNCVATYDGGSWDSGWTVALQADGKIVAADKSYSGTDSDVLTVRFIGDAVGGGAAPTLLLGGGGGCFIATAAYGSHMAREVKVFQRVRDEYLLPNELGRIFVSAYYRYSPTLAHWIAEHPVMRQIVRVSLYPILELSKCFMGENPLK